MAGIYRKKPVEVEAFRLPEKPLEHAGEWPDWFLEQLSHGYVRVYNQCCVITTLDGEMLASGGDYIIQGINGEIYPCKPDIFEKTYEFVGYSGDHLRKDSNIV